jgi:hypothetical protein
MYFSQRSRYTAQELTAMFIIKISGHLGILFFLYRPVPSSVFSASNFVLQNVHEEGTFPADRTE